MKCKTFEEYEGFVRGNHTSKKTIDVYLSHPKKLLRVLGKTLDEITQKDIDEYRAKYFRECKRNGNAVRFYSIRKCLRWVGRDDLYIDQITPNDADKTALPDEEIAKIFLTVKDLKPLHRLVFHLEFDAIMRPRSIRNLKLSDRYQNTIQYRGKTGIRTVTMTPELQKAWDDYVDNQRMKGYGKNDEYLIISDYGRSRGKRYSTNDGITRIIKEILMWSNVKIPPRESPSNYLIKRTSITYQLKICNDPKIIQIQAGHCDLKQTMKYNTINQNHLNEYVGLLQSKTDDLRKNTGLNKTKNI